MTLPLSPPPPTLSSSSRTRWASKMGLSDLRALGLPRRASGTQSRWESLPARSGNWIGKGEVTGAEGERERGMEIAAGAGERPCPSLVLAPDRERHRYLRLPKRQHLRQSTACRHCPSSPGKFLRRLKVIGPGYGASCALSPAPLAPWGWAGHNAGPFASEDTEVQVAKCLPRGGLDIPAFSICYSDSPPI